MNARRAAPALLALLVALAAAGVHAGPATSDALRAPRPRGGEWFGLYLMDKKVGYIFTDVFARAPDRVVAVNDFVFKASVGKAIAERRHKETRVYEARPGGRLLSFVVEQSGDGGQQTLEGTATPTGLKVVRRRPGMANEVLNLPATREKVEDADQARVALLRGRAVEGDVLDGQDLGSYRVTTTLGESTELVRGGVKVHLRKVVTLSAKEKVPVEGFFNDAGEMLEIQFGNNMKALQEPKDVAERLDQVEVFGLTRVVLPRRLPARASTIPGDVTLVLSGLPQRFFRDTERQHFKALADGAVELTVMAAFPDPKRIARRPLKAPEGAKYLKSDILVESTSPEIVKAAKAIAGGEANAWRAAEKVNTWVHRTLKKDYGASSDRATDVLRQKKGDCTEHSLLAVALLRALGIPAKRVDGLIFMEQEDGVPAYYWHEWVAAWVGEWTQLDPTFGQLVADATHLELGEEGNAEITPLIGQLKVTDVR